MLPRRSNSGCLTCRARHVKCDERWPLCGNCAIKSRECAWPQSNGNRKERGAEGAEEPPFVGQGISGERRHAEQTSTASPLRHSPSSQIFEKTYSNTLTPHEASQVVYFSKNIASWLDCTDATRLFTIHIPHLAKTNSILLHAVMAISARHQGYTVQAEEAYESCISRLIPLLNDPDQTLFSTPAVVCATVILRVYEQMSVVTSGTDQESHLTGVGALLNAHCGFKAGCCPSSLREACFWVWIRQAMYNACVSQSRLNINLSDIEVTLPVASPDSMQSWVEIETAWANSVVFLCARIIDTSFSSSIKEQGVWQSLKDDLDRWTSERPASFDPVGFHYTNATFPEIRFSSPWHAMAFGYYHLSAMLLVIFKPSQYANRFAFHPTNFKHKQEQVLEHARSLCGACSSNTDVPPLFITLCHSIFIWSATVFDPHEKAGTVQLLELFERRHYWPTAWIVESIKEVWNS